MDVVAVPHVGTSSSLSPSRRQGAGQLMEPARFDFGPPLALARVGRPLSEER